MIGLIVSGLSGGKNSLTITEKENGGRTTKENI